MGLESGRADLTRARLHGADLTRVNALDTNFFQAELPGATLDHGIFINANLNEADLTGA